MPSVAVEKSVWLQVPTYTAEEDRKLIAAVAGRGFGVTTPTTRQRSHGVLGRQGTGAFASTEPLTVKQTSTASLQVMVNAGSALVTGSQSSAAGVFSCRNQSTKTITGIGAGHATLPRTDIVVLKVRTNEYPAFTDNDTILDYIQGTPASSPVAPAVPADSLRLATVNVPAAASTITSAMIVNDAPTAGLFSGVMPVANLGDAQGVTDAQNGDLFIDSHGVLHQKVGGVLTPCSGIVAEFSGASQAINSATADKTLNSPTVRPSSIAASNFWNSANSARAVAPWTGLYDFSVHVRSTAAPSSLGWLVRLMKNADAGRDAAITLNHNGSMTGVLNLCMSVQGVYLAANDYVRIVVETTSTTNIVIDSGSQVFRMVYRGPVG